MGQLDLELGLGDLIARQVECMFDDLSSSIEQIRTGDLRAVALTSLRPSEIVES